MRRVTTMILEKKKIECISKLSEINVNDYVIRYDLEDYDSGRYGVVLFKNSDIVLIKYTNDGYEVLTKNELEEDKDVWAYQVISPEEFAAQNI